MRTRFHRGSPAISDRQCECHPRAASASHSSIAVSSRTSIDWRSCWRQKPASEPRTRQANHGITLGYYENELVRRIDRQHRSIGRFFRDEIASPLGLDVDIRLPENIANLRLATISRPRARHAARVSTSLHTPHAESALQRRPRAERFRASPRQGAYLCPQL